MGILGINFLIIFVLIFNVILAYLNIKFLNNFLISNILVNLGNWCNIDLLNIKWLFQNNNIIALISSVVISISTIIHIYSIYYMGNDNNYLKFIMLLNIFTFFMLFLIFSSQLIIMLIGWESVGICSFLLINFWSVRQEANQSAIKAVLFNKIGDLGFIVVILISLYIINDTSLLNINFLIFNFSNIIFWNLNIIKIVGYCLLLAAFGKSAQFFFHLWLTDAMEGPTPVSGLIHSATMVIAGVFLIIRVFPIIKYSKELLLIIMLVGTITTLITSLIAIISFDIKRIIANSTASHIGLMFMSLGLGDLSISLFHLVTHAYFKAFGFLFAGYLIHLLLNEQDCRQISGFFNILPIISILEEYWCITMLNLPNLSSYYSKELFFNSYWSYSNLLIYSFIIFCSFLMCFLSFICSSLYIAYLLSWLSDQATIKKYILKNIKELNYIALFILIILALFSQLVGFILVNIFVNNYFFNTLTQSLYFFVADWSELKLLSALCGILIITCIADFISDIFFKKNYFKNLNNINKINNSYNKTIFILWFIFNKSLVYLFLLLTIFYLININNYYINWKNFNKIIVSFSLDNLLNFLFYNILNEAFLIFYSIDNYLVETSNHLFLFQKISYFSQKFVFNKYIIQINFNFILVITFLLFLNYYLWL